MTDHKILALLRNPYGLDECEIREVRLKAADRIEELIKEYDSVLEWARENGLDTTISNRGTK